MINNKLIHFRTLSNFQTQLGNGNVSENSIVFIKDAQMIWTHQTYYDCSAIDISKYSTTEELMTILSSYALKTDIPTNVSQLTNDAGYLTTHQDISNLATKSELTTGLAAKQNVIDDLATIRSNASKGATALQSVPEEYVTDSELTAKGYATTSQIPTNLSQLTADATHRLVTDTQITNWNAKVDDSDISDMLTKTEAANTYQPAGNYITSIPAEYITESELEAKGYLTEHQDISNLATKTELTTGLNSKVDQSTFDTLVGGDASSAIESFNEIVEFLDGIEDSESLDSILAAKANASDIPTALSELTQDSTHRVVTDAEKTAWNAKSNFSGSYNDLTNKPTIPTVNNATLTISKNGTAIDTFTANASSNKTINITVSKSDVGLGNVDNTADADKSVSYATTAGSATSATKATQDASGNVITSTYATKTELEGKMDNVTLAAVATSGSYNDLTDKPTIPTTTSALTNDSNFSITLSFTEVSASSWVSDDTYVDYPYRCDVVCNGVLATDYAELVFNVDQAVSGNYAPVCNTKANAVSIWSSLNISITIPTIIITRKS